MDYDSDSYAPLAPGLQSTQLHFPRGHEPRPFPRYLTHHGSYSLSAIATRAFLLGTTFSLSLALTILFRHSYPQLPLFISCLSAFHFLEFYVTAAYNPSRAKVEAFILTNNGAAYQIAHSAAMLEGALEWWLWPQLKGCVWLILLGAGMVGVGQWWRFMAMRGAGRNFSHYVVTEKEPGHVLVTDGVYTYIRHPSYFGYYCWALGTQLMLGNPVCTVGFAGFLWMFFKHRIDDEETHLVDFFGEQYVEYKKRSWSGIPGVSGWKPTKRE